MVCTPERQNQYRGGKRMSNVAYVDQARAWGRLLEERERSACDGDLELARARIEAKYGIPSSSLYALRRRQPKTIPADLYDRLAAAVEDACSKQIRTLESEIAIAQAARGSRHLVVRAAIAARDLAEKILGEKSDASFDI
jgi:hypothetical protein